MMSGAKETFEKLGYRLDSKNKNVSRLIYTKDDENIIDFRLKEKSYSKFGANTLPPDDITIEEHIAIHQQMKELGWLDE